ncbi:hypothetical protein [uncultured Clostridium sp.]|uniref:hypothetical protein n=1 Tax=uncultured Clostridium sp. TaxID=59620 RepID=UPI00260EDB96|nr:hypothetical protein [uncultured Clostridium sp.]
MKFKLDKTNMELYQEEILLKKYGDYLNENKIVDSKESFESFIVDLLNLGN